MHRLVNEVTDRKVKLCIVWVSCPRDVLRQRMIDRGSPRDHAKLADWPAYSATVDEDFPQRIRGEHLVFDNRNPERFEQQLQQIIEGLSAG
jgi:hypothetical protein